MICDDIVFGKENISLKMESLIPTQEEYIFYDKKDNTQWLLSSYESEMLRENLLVLEKLPSKSIAELITLMLASPDIEHTISLCLMIYDRDFDHNKDNRLLMINALEQYLDQNKVDTAATKVKLCVLESSLFNPTNKDDIMNKSYEQIRSDTLFYENIALRSKALLDKIKAIEKNISEG